MYNAEQGCKLDSALGECEWPYVRVLLERQLRSTIAKASSKAQAVGFKVQIDQIGHWHKAQFAEWVACSGVRVLHFVRDATLASFYALQADTLDTLARGGARVPFVDSHGGVAAQLVSNRGKLTLDVANAVDYVRRLEQSHRDMRRALQYHPSGDVQYHRMSYEMAADGSPAGVAHWRAALAFLDLSVSRGSLPLKLDKTKRLHTASRCEDKIENWSEIAAALVGSETFFACG